MPKKEDDLEPTIDDDSGATLYLPSSSMLCRHKFPPAARRALSATATGPQTMSPATSRMATRRQPMAREETQRVRSSPAVRKSHGKPCRSSA